jgi:hypothetical protein
MVVVKTLIMAGCSFIALAIVVETGKVAELFSSLALLIAG